jgi:hypothetical protein
VSGTAALTLSVQARVALVSAALMIGVSLSLMFGWSGAFYAVPLIVGVCVEAWFPSIGRLVVGLALMLSFVVAALFITPFAVVGVFSFGNPASDSIFFLQFVAAWAALALVGWAVWAFVKFERARKLGRAGVMTASS